VQTCQSSNLCSKLDHLCHEIHLRQNHYHSQNRQNIPDASFALEQKRICLIWHLDSEHTWAKIGSDSNLRSTVDSRVRKSFVSQVPKKAKIGFVG